MHQGTMHRLSTLVLCALGLSLAACQASEPAALAAAGPSFPAQLLGTTAKDLVCGMDVTVAAGTPWLQHGQAHYFFCAQECREQFKADPAKYVKPCECGKHADGKPCGCGKHADGKPCECGKHADGKPCECGKQADGKPCECGKHADGKPCGCGKHADGKPCGCGQHQAGTPCGQHQAATPCPHAAGAAAGAPCPHAAAHGGQQAHPCGQHKLDAYPR